MWNIQIYQDPSILLLEQTIPADRDPNEEAAKLMQTALDEGRPVVALIRDTNRESCAYLYPRPAGIDIEFEEMRDTITQSLGENRGFEALFLADSALRGSSKDDLEVILLSSATFEHMGYFELAAQSLEAGLKDCFEEVKRAAIQIRLARARLKSGRKDGVLDLVNQGIDCPGLPEELKIQALILRATQEEPETALETLDELLDLGEEHLGDHRLVAEALELNADVLTELDEPKKAQEFYLAAGRMLLSLKDPYFFSLNERLVVHMLRHQDLSGALSLSEEMFKLLQAGKFPAEAHVPFMVFAARVYDKLDEPEAAEKFRQEAKRLDPIEAERVEKAVTAALEQPKRPVTTAG